MLLQCVNKRCKYKWVINVIRWDCSSSKLCVVLWSWFSLQHGASGKNGHHWLNHSIIFLTANDRQVFQPPTKQTPVWEHRVIITFLQKPPQTPSKPFIYSSDIDQWLLLQFCKISPLQKIMRACRWQGQTNHCSKPGRETECQSHGTVAGFPCLHVPE